MDKVVEKNEQISILDIPRGQLTPGMQQYQDVKKEHPDCLIMLRMGDFYEMFYEDAITSARELEITLTARGQGEKRAPLAGIPYHALDNYLHKLIKKGHKVAIVEQLEDPKKAKGLVKRGVVRIITPGTVIESSMLNEKENNYILALTSKGDNFTFAYCDLSTGEFFTSKSNNIFNDLTRINPSECILPESLLVNQELITKIKKLHCFVNTLEDYYFKLSVAKETLQNHFNLNFGLEESNLAVSGALLYYLLQTQKNSLTHIQNIKTISNTKMILDPSTIKNLELLKNMKDNSVKGSLLSILDQTVTAMGARLLKKWIKEPLLKKELINHRLNSIKALNENVIVREEIIALLQQVYDLERLISRVNYGNANPRDLLALKRSLQQIPELKDKLKEFDAQLLESISKIDGLEDTAELIEKAVSEDAPITIREGKIINRGYHQDLDQLKDIQRNGKKYLQQLEEREKEKTGITTLKIGYTRVFGYFIEVTKKNLSLVPKDYIRKQTTANSERYITEELKDEEEKILTAQEKIQELEYNLFQDLLKKITLRTSAIQESAQKLAVLDVLTSLAKVALEHNFTFPHFVEEKVLQLRNCRHPVVEAIESNFIGNDVLINDGEMMIITGPNMSGKSTLMRQVALIVLMAQMGSFVPADEAVLSIVDRIFTRVGAYDDLSSGESTFMVEMNETASILNNATENSLIILDEIGRGTSTFDGVSIAWSVAEHIYQKIKAKTMFSTHYHVMNKLAEKFSQINNYNLAAKERHGEIVFLRKLIKGGTDNSYGVHVAKLAGLPSAVVQRAQEIQRKLEEDDQMLEKVTVKKIKEQTDLINFQ